MDPKYGSSHCHNLSDRGSQVADEAGWYFNQIKGTCEEVNEADIVSCVEYDNSGEFLATGDRGGRIVIFQRDLEQRGQRRVNHNVYCTFVSHEPEFDYLKSLEIEEKINKIRWLPQNTHVRLLLSTNDKTIKLWRIAERRKRAVGYNLPLGNSSFSNVNGSPNGSFPRQVDHPRFSNSDDLCVPHFEEIEPTVEAIPRRVFANAHAYLINSLSVNSDQETFLSADDLRINLWNLQITDQSFNIVDMKPSNMEDLTEVITAAQFHPSACSLFIYSSSRGTIRLCDMRERALCDQHALAFEELDGPMTGSYFSEIIHNISDLNFSHCGRFILSRDYLTVKVWDMKMSHKPIETYPVHNYLQNKLCALYNNECIFDKFECQWSPDDRFIVTGSYNNDFRVFDRLSQKDVLLEASREAMENSHMGKLQEVKIKPEITSMDWDDDGIPVESLDFSRKLLHFSWHPQENCVALAGTSTLYLLDFVPGPPDSSTGSSTDAVICTTRLSSDSPMVDATGDVSSIAANA